MSHIRDFYESKKLRNYFYFQSSQNLQDSWKKDKVYSSYQQRQKQAIINKKLRDNNQLDFQKGLFKKQSEYINNIKDQNEKKNDKQYQQLRTQGPSRSKQQIKANVIKNYYKSDEIQKNVKSLLSNEEQQQTNNQQQKKKQKNQQVLDILDDFEADFYPSQQNQQQSQQFITQLESEDKQVLIKKMKNINQKIDMKKIDMKKSQEENVEQQKSSIVLQNQEEVKDKMESEKEMIQKKFNKEEIKRQRFSNFLVTPTLSSFNKKNMQMDQKLREIQQQDAQSELEQLKMTQEQHLMIRTSFYNINKTTELKKYRDHLQTLGML